MPEISPGFDSFHASPSGGPTEDGGQAAGHRFGVEHLRRDDFMPSLCRRAAQVQAMDPLRNSLRLINRPRDEYGNRRNRVGQAGYAMS